MSANSEVRGYLEDSGEPFHIDVTAEVLKAAERQGVKVTDRRGMSGERMTCYENAASNRMQRYLRHAITPQQAAEIVRIVKDELDA
jgi:hypothetical protein